MDAYKTIFLHVVLYRLSWTMEFHVNSEFKNCKQYANDYEVLEHFPFPVKINPETDDWNRSIAMTHRTAGFIDSLTLAELNATIPESIFCLKELRYLTIKNMVFTNGVVSDNLVNLPLLQRLEITNTIINNMTNQLASLTRLYYLILVNCSISQLPNLSSLSDLYHLQLEQNQLSKINGLNADIHSLLLSNNLFTEIPRVETPTYVEELSMNNNPLKHIMTIDSFINIEKVDLHNTTLAFIPPTINKLQKVKYLDLSYNNLFYLPRDILELNKLSILYVNNNSFSNRDIETIKLYFNTSHPNMTLRIE
ncbi:hypothetical protein I4U23_004261 [Adineta vaga]|nr:hypothetical protein I4U23_004261 [Adineta vaga]